MLNQHQINLLKNFVKKTYANSELAGKEIDLDGQVLDYIDESLSYQENKRILIEKMKELGIISEAKSKKQVKDELEYYTQESIEFVEKQIQEELEKQIEEIKKTQDTQLITEKFYTLSNLVKALIKSENIHSLIVEGEAGIGKTYATIKTLAKENIPFLMINSHITPLELYNFLYKNYNKIILIDDNGNLFKNDTCKAILLSALFSPIGRRIVSYYSSSEKLKAPSEFEFVGKIIFLTNKLSEELTNLKSRCFYYKFELSFQDKLLLMYEIAKTNNIPLEIVDFIKENCNEAHQIDLRTLIKLYELYKYSENWKRLAVDILEVDENLFLVRELLKKYPSEEACREFIKQTGLSRRTFYNYKKKLKIGE